MSTLTKNSVTFVSHIVPFSEIEDFGHKILEIQIENHYINKGLKDLDHTEIFLSKPKELAELSKNGLVAVITKKENGVFTQEVAGYAIAVPSSFDPANRVMKKITEKIKGEEKENEFFLIDAFACHSNGKEFIRMMKKLGKNLGNKKVYVPIHSMNENFKKIIEIFGLTFEYGPEQTLSTEVGVIHLPYKLLTRDQK